MALCRCSDHPASITDGYVAYAEPVGFPQASSICGRKDCKNNGLIYLKADEVLQFDAGDRIFSFATNVTKVKVKDPLVRLVSKEFRIEHRGKNRERERMSCEIIAVRSGGYIWSIYLYGKNIQSTVYNNTDACREELVQIADKINAFRNSENEDSEFCEIFTENGVSWWSINLNNVNAKSPRYENRETCHTQLVEIENCLRNPRIAS